MYFTLYLYNIKRTMNKDSGRADSAKLFNRLAVLRTERGLSRQQLAEALGVNYQTVGYLERGEYNPSLELALRIAELFALPVEAVFSRSAFAPLSQMLYPPSKRTPE